MDNYIGKIDAEWVDARVELPPDGWHGLIIWKVNGDLRIGHWIGMEWRSPGAEPFTYYLSEIVAWLRIGGPSTAIPRERVQAAVDDVRIMRDLSIYDQDFVPSTIQDVLQKVLDFLAVLEGDNENAMNALDLHAQLQETLDAIRTPTEAQ